MRGSSCEAGKDLEYSQASHWAASLGDTVPLFSLSVRNMELLNENFWKILFYLRVDILTNNHVWGSRASDHFDTLIGINNIIKFIYSSFMSRASVQMAYKH